MDIELRQEDQRANRLKTEILDLVENIDSIDLPVAKKIIERATQIRDEAEHPISPDNLDSWREVFEVSERTILFLLAKFPDTFLPDEKLVKQLVSDKNRRTQQLHELKKEYPYAVRISSNAHLYLDSLRQIHTMYDPDNKSKRASWKNWEHEMGHYSHRLAINKPISEKVQTEFVAIIYKKGDELGYRPAVFQDQTGLSHKELVFLAAGDIHDLSGGDMIDIARGVTSEAKRIIVRSLQKLRK